MDETRVFKLPLMEGMQTIRLDEDSLDYDWKGQTRDFHGTLPYENLRLKMRITRKDKTFSYVAVLILAVAVVVAVFLPDRLSHYGVTAVALLLSNVIIFGIRQRRLGKRICVQIDPKPFGFAGELPVPDTSKGRRFIDELETAWSTSLRRRFLVSDVHPALLLKRIDWLEFIGVLTSEEAVAERSTVDIDAQTEPKMIGFAVN